MRPEAGLSFVTWPLTEAVDWCGEWSHDGFSGVEEGTPIQGEN